MRKFLALIFALYLGVFFSADLSYGRAGKGSSTHFRSYKAQDFNRVNKPSNQTPIYSAQKQQQTFQPQQKPSFFTNPIFKYLIGGLIFGALLSLLFGYGLHFSTPGLLEIILIVGLIYLIFKLLSKKKEEPAYATGTTLSPSISQIDNSSQTSSDIYINEELIINLARNIFYDIQKAWSEGDLSKVKNFLTERMYNYLDNQLQELKSKGLINVIQDPKIDNIEIVHVEEEGNNKVVIVKIDAHMVDYIVDKDRNIIEGNKNNTVYFTEYWAFVGKALDWKLDDIKQVGDV